MNWKKILLMIGIVLLLGAALPLRAQTGCDDSPEDPTLVLAVVGGIGAICAAMWVRRNAKHGRDLPE
jgi:XrtJ-associated TM-motif-TM protein